MTSSQKVIKRLFDIVFSTLALIFFGIFIILFVLISRIKFNENGIFRQKRVGCNSKLFTIYKIKSISSQKEEDITKYGAFLRVFKIDELPQFFNVLIGDMSIVGPRPDIPGFADKLKSEDSIILTVKPGITGPASIKFKNEERLLKKMDNPDKYNKTIIWPKKVEINKEYVKNYSLSKDIYYIYKTIF